MCSVPERSIPNHPVRRKPNIPEVPRCLTNDRLLVSKLFAICVILATMTSFTDAQIIQGSIARCELEGEEIFVPGISSDPCITCMCLRHEVKCSRRTCPDNEGCHVIPFDKPESQCCLTCQGCTYKRQSHPSGDQWADPSDPCRILTCVAGVVTSSIRQCHVTCRNPRLVTGQCCPLCEGCSYNGVNYLEGDTFPSHIDQCALCRCQNGTISCHKPECPVQNCPALYMYTPAGQCCPLCRGTRQVYLPPGGACLFRRQVYEDGSVVVLDNCTRCTCVAGTVMCERISCPILDCATDDILPPGAPLTGSVATTTSAETRCCPRCALPKRRCKLFGKKHLHGTTWRRDICTHCHCDDGTVRCQAESCSNSIECPNNTRLKMQPGQCCPQCVDDGALCTVFGDPHYRSFDGRIFNFQGTCDYLLTQTCHTGDLTVIVRNDARLTDQYAWTKSVRIHVNGAKVYFLQKNRVKVNQKRVNLPYVSRDGSFSIVSTGRQVALKTTVGVKVKWDGDSYLEVYVPPTLKHKMCGLCGNYNNDKSDDFIGRTGELHLDADDFGNSWVVPAKRCKATSGNSSEHRPSPCIFDIVRRRRAEKQCAELYKPEFDQCHSEADNTQAYYASCMTDVCECPDGRQCYCESIVAFTRACAQKGLDLQPFIPTACKAADCPRRAVWSECTSPCLPTCDNPLYDVTYACQSQACAPGCQCPDGKVLHKNSCIRKSKCPKRTNTETKPNKPKKRKKKKYKTPLDYLIEH